MKIDLHDGVAIKLHGIISCQPRVPAEDRGFFLKKLLGPDRPVRDMNELIVLFEKSIRRTHFVSNPIPRDSPWKSSIILGKTEDSIGHAEVRFACGDVKKSKNGEFEFLFSVVVAAKKASKEKQASDIEGVFSRIRQLLQHLGVAPDEIVKHTTFDLSEKAILLCEWLPETWEMLFSHAAEDVMHEMTKRASLEVTSW